MFSEIRASIEGTFKDGWPTASTNVPYAFENVAFKQPASKRFVRLTVRFGRPYHLTIGSKRVPRQPGVAIVQIFTPKNWTKGNADSRNLADIAKSLFEFQQFRQDAITIHFMDPGELHTVGERNNFFQENLSLHFEAHEVVTVLI